MCVVFCLVFLFLRSSSILFWCFCFCINLCVFRCVFVVGLEFVCLIAFLDSLLKVGMLKGAGAETNVEGSAQSIPSPPSPRCEASASLDWVRTYGVASASPLCGHPRLQNLLLNVGVCFLFLVLNCVSKFKLYLIRFLYFSCVVYMCI